MNKITYKYSRIIHLKMNNIYCCPIKININPINKDISEFKPAVHTAISPEIVSTEFVNFLDSLNTKVTLVEAFYNPPFNVSGIHTDSLKGNYAKINFIYGGEHSVMCWYRVNEGVHKTSLKKTPIKTYAFDYEQDEVTLVHQEFLHSPSLVQVGIPHNIVNAHQPRWCLSFVIVHKQNGRRIRFEEGLEIFGRC